VKNSTLFKTGLIGSFVAAICCATPVLVILLGALGLSALVGYIDIVVLPLLAVLLVVTLVAWWRIRREAACSPAPSTDRPEVR